MSPFPFICSVSLLNPVPVKILVKADYELVFDPVGRCSQVAAWSHGVLENLGLGILCRRKDLDLFPLGDGNLAGIFQQRPGSFLIDLLFFGVDNIFGFNLLVLKKLLSINAGLSAFT